MQKLVCDPCYKQGGRASSLATFPSGNWQEMLEKTLEEWQVELGEVPVSSISS